jgi:glc operon protein GlcG
MRSFSPLLLFAVAVCLGAPAGAQTASPPPTPAPAGGTPEQMPFATPYGAPITAERAVGVVNAVLGEARKHPTWRFAISVVDPSGELVYFYKMDDTQFASIEISQNKARTAARFRRETRVFYNAFEAGHHFSQRSAARSWRRPAVIRSSKAGNSLARSAAAAGPAIRTRWHAAREPLPSSRLAGRARACQR